MKKIKAILWAVFGNNEAPDPPPWYMPEWPAWRRLFYWLFLRNPLHNLFWHVLGMASRRHMVHYDNVFNPTGGLNIVLSFISYDGKRVKWYFGWRPDSGALGIKLNRK